MLKNVKESAINDERLATVFLLTTDYTDYTVFFLKLLHILHSMATRSYARWPTDENTMLASTMIYFRREISDSFFLLTTDYTDYTVFF